MSRASRLYRTRGGLVVEEAGACRRLPALDWDTAFNERDRLDGGETCSAPLVEELRAPIGSQEVWAAGVTYERSREARIEEAQAAKGGDFYARVYEAERPELFFKATPHRVAGPGGTVRIRRDARWNVPEPELTVALDRTGRIVGYTVGNDVSARDIEGENPLYLPQAKIYDGSCALGPCLLLRDEPLPPATEIALEVHRQGREIFRGATTLARLRRRLETLAEYLFREASFPSGAYLMTGTGIVPPAGFTLRSGDLVRITIEPIGTLVNTVA
jgi:2-dehydro-3-deoxy-D-arabinonate dehydratase